MAVFKCKMCGGNLEVQENNLALCEHCGTQQTIPSMDDEKKLALFNRANTLRMKNEFDKAAGIYESIIADLPEEAEAYWGLVLCKYGIEYVDDKDGKKVPTCHRTLPTSVMEDGDFDMACANADSSAKLMYREEAKAIDGIQKKILEIAATETPYDIFICYKETDDITGSRTEDSMDAQDIYTELIKEGYKVFFSRVSLREVAGTEYEPYIYAALSSAKVMLAIGTKFEYYDAVWVKNEWSRFISMMQGNKSKVLIPCFKNMDAYDIPKEFKNMQALDMSDVTFSSSLIANIKRLMPKESQKEIPKEDIIKEVAERNKEENISNLLTRVSIFLKDGNFKSADEYCEKVLDLDPENGKAYFYKFMVEAEVTEESQIGRISIPLGNFPSFEKAFDYGDEKQILLLSKYAEYVSNKYNENTYNELIKKTKTANSYDDWMAIANGFMKIGLYKNGFSLAGKAKKKADLCKKIVSQGKVVERELEKINTTHFIKRSSNFWGFGFVYDYLAPKIYLGIGVLIWAFLIWMFEGDIAFLFEDLNREMANGTGYLIFGIVIYIPLIFLMLSIIEAIIKTIITTSKNSKAKKEFNETLSKKKQCANMLANEVEEAKREYNKITFDN